MQTIGVIGAPSSAGAYAPGQERAPQALRDVGLARRLEEHGARCTTAGTPRACGGRPTRRRRARRTWPAVIRTIDALTEELTAALHDDGRALVLGGDCTVGMAAVRGVRPRRRARLPRHARRHEHARQHDRRRARLDGRRAPAPARRHGAGPRPASARCEPDHLSLLGFEQSQATPWELRQIAALGIAATRPPTLTEDPAAAARQALASLPPGASGSWCTSTST